MSYETKVLFTVEQVSEVVHLQDSRLPTYGNKALIGKLFSRIRNDRPFLALIEVDRLVQLNSWCNNKCVKRVRHFLR